VTFNEREVSEKNLRSTIFMATFTEESKRDVSRSSGATIDDLQLGCLQRIASATEAMSKNFLSMSSELDRYKRWYEDEKKRRAGIALSNRALRGVITRLKKKV
jgi:hypothetical protein